MSQLLGRIAKLSSSLSSIGKHGLCFSESRFFSTATATPYLLFDDSNHKRGGASGEATVLDMNLYDPRKQERVKIPDQTLPKELEGSMRIGSSRGWVGMRNVHDSTIRLTNVFNPCASVSSHKVISLPPLDGYRGHVSNISLSASPTNQEDCVVAARSTSSALSLCRPGDSEWTFIKVPFFASEVMFSGRDRKFYLHRSREDEYEGPVDLDCFDFPQVSLHQRFPLSEIPKTRQDQLISTLKKSYLVESPSGDSFIVYWYNEFLIKDDIGPPRGFVVFRQDPEQRIASYTQDIGDLCIFLGQNEAFCVSATQYPGLKPNSVYFASFDTGFGFYDLSSNTLHDLTDSVPFSSSFLWLAPLQ